MNLKKIYLSIFAITLSVIALLYGINPQWFTDTFLDTSMIIHTDAAHILRAVSGLYLALIGFFIYGIFDEKYTDAAIVITAVFCFGLASGRSVSILFDGLPSPILLLYVFMEYSIVPIAYLLLKKTAATSSSHQVSLA
ncbi:DUF4345 domain-containing protein [Flammeovirga kamogawensis]|uniref:DUF4345 domain-containing protein n=1 Tax=Flammeovirga kamogawensis TaxID=373891 RepID=A0ABX8GVG0_9BACT|nr:DUF4345 domain-containing protein [Flammeovirga kamogawensis]MBB6461677.1 hypothetical protein [Flammeovirga kamogawensis]QWG07398.1 DUF4345 domain-containing protein [Flammeovirga kamogawensis]TRX69211.1 DUF4345 domain-containing protein [Flammeovirga kamogawensis]